VEPTALSGAFVLPLSGRITNQVLADGGAYFVATSTGEVVSFTPAGVVRWRVQLGQLTNKCAQLDGYGVTGTGVIDPGSSTLYVMDAFGRLHALSLATGAERAGWPVKIYADDRRELDWGALSLVDGSVYVPTASYCDTSGTPGAVYRVDTASGSVSQWLSVPLSAGGGGGPWGWGGLAYDSSLNTLFAATSGAFNGGTNTGDAFTELVGHGDQLVQLNPDLTVAAGSHPADIPDRMDLDFVGSPIVLNRPGCGQLVAATDKDDTVYLWHTNAVSSGPVAEIAVEPYNAADPMLAQLAWSPALDSLYTATGTQLVRIAISADCTAAVSWRDPLGTQTENGSPTISGNTVWISVNGKPSLDGFNADTGKRLFQTPLGGTTLTAPTIVNDQLVVGTFTGLVEGFDFQTR
jgi:PQQ-like domain